MAEYAPDAIAGIITTLQAAGMSAINAGIIGDQAHTYGYHRCRDVLPPGDYSIQTPPDQRGDGQAAAGLDITWTYDTDHYLASGRLLTACQNRDPRAVKGIREFYGSLDGMSVIGWDTWDDCPATSDDSHLWHVHVSLYREYVNDPAVCQGIASIMTAGAAAAPPAAELPEGKQAMLIQKESDRLGAVVLGGKAVLVRSSKDYEAMKAGGLPAAIVSDALFNNIGTAFGGFRG